MCDDGDCIDQKFGIPNFEQSPPPPIIIPGVGDPNNKLTQNPEKKEGGIDTQALDLLSRVCLLHKPEMI